LDVSAFGHLLCFLLDPVIPTKQLTGEADQLRVEGPAALSPATAASRAAKNSRSLDYEDRSLRERSSPLGMTEVIFVHLQLRPEGAPLQNSSSPLFLGRLSGNNHASMPPNIPASTTVIGQNQITRQSGYIRKMATNARQCIVSRQAIASQKLQWPQRRLDCRTVIQKSKPVKTKNPIQPSLNQPLILSVTPSRIVSAKNITNTASEANAKPIQSNSRRTTEPRVRPSGPVSAANDVLTPSTPPSSS
jgi:hypothetical protein